MSAGRKPDFRVMFPVRQTNSNGKNKEEKATWHTLGAAWRHDGGTIGVVLDVGVPITLEPGTQLVLCENDSEPEPGSNG